VAARQVAQRNIAEARQAAQRYSPENLEILQFLIKAKNSSHGYTNLKRPRFLLVSNLEKI
jgi:hypothetical protein